MGKAKRRLGIVFPPGNVVFEQEARYYLPSEVVMHSNRLSRANAEMTADSLRSMEGSIERAVRDLSNAYPEVIVYGCTGGSFMDGPGHEDDIAAQITTYTGISAVTTTKAVLEAIAALGVRRLFLITPYPNAFTEQEVAFLEHCGVTVTGYANIVCNSSEEIRAVTSGQLRELVEANRGAASEADAVFISCANLASADIVAELEGDLGMPVFSSVQASFWAALKRMPGVRPLVDVRLFAV